MAKSKDIEEKEIEKFEKATEAGATKKAVEATEKKILARPQVTARPLGVGTFMDLVEEVAWLKVRIEALEK